MTNPKGPKFIKNAKEIKEQASKLGKEAIKTAGTVKSVIQTGVHTSKSAFKKAKKVLNKDGISKGVSATSKGAKVLAKGARVASKGADTIAKSVEKASDKMEQWTDKLKNK